MGGGVVCFMIDYDLQTPILWQMMIYTFPLCQNLSTRPIVCMMIWLQQEAPTAL